MLVTTTKNTTGVCTIAAIDEYWTFRKSAKLGEPLFRAGAKGISKTKPTHAMSSAAVQIILKSVLSKAGSVRLCGLLASVLAAVEQPHLPLVESQTVSFVHTGGGGRGLTECILTCNLLKGNPGQHA